MEEKPQKQHDWLQKLVGEWTYEADAAMGPDQPAEKATGVEIVRSIGDLWIVAEAEGDMPGGGRAKSVMTLGFDPQKNHFVGSWIGSMMTNQWIYEGTLDSSERVLSLDSEGPDFEHEGQTAQYRDVIEVMSDDHRTLSGHVLGREGQWTKFMTTHYRRR